MNNDLISRSALKKAMFDESYIIVTSNECGTKIARLGLTINEIDKIIDNAPTVLHDNYSMGYQDGVKKVLSERPQGEWIVDGHHYKCSRCGKTLAIMFSETDDDDLIGCPFCLADMRGGRE